MILQSQNKNRFSILHTLETLSIFLFMIVKDGDRWKFNTKQNFRVRSVNFNCLVNLTFLFGYISRKNKGQISFEVSINQ